IHRACVRPMRGDRQQSRMARAPSYASRMRVAMRADHATIPVVSGALRVVVVADTHSKPHPRAAELIAREKPDRILHAGDIGQLDVIDALAEIAPTIAVRGNIDIRARSLPDALTLHLVEDDENLL